MDRRQRKTREAIFSAFTGLLSKKNYSKISVQQIIDAADIGRTTFYAHFETKDFLLEELLKELFDHIINTAMGLPHEHFHYSCCDKNESVFLHLLKHLQENDLNILGLLSCENNEIFLKYFKRNLKTLIISQYAEKGRLKISEMPEDYVINHICSSFVDTVSWWIAHKMRETPETVTDYFLSVMEPVFIDI